jgi:NADPH:quinone reductase-like Zn-dependent oxidoreductase
MSLPTLSRSFRRSADSKSIELSEDALPKSLQPTEVLVQVHAVSLNYRDVAMIKGKYVVPVLDRGVPCSDASASVIAIGESVDLFKIGDYVSPTAHLYWLDRKDKLRQGSATGGDVDGLLRQYAIFDQKVLTRLPPHLSHEEASTICCAGTTAWTALDFHLKDKPKPESALMQGTGGVSLFALLLCLAAGITPVITSSSDAKLARIKAVAKEDQTVLGINYNTTPDWDEEAYKVTNGKGVDYVVNTVGLTSIEKSFNSLSSFGGTVSLVGFLGGPGDGNSMEMGELIHSILIKSARIQ